MSGERRPRTPTFTHEGLAARGTWAMRDYVDWPTKESGERVGLTGYGHYLEEYVREHGAWRIARTHLARLRVDTLRAGTIACQAGQLGCTPNQSQDAEVCDGADNDSYPIPRRGLVRRSRNAPRGDLPTRHSAPSRSSLASRSLRSA